MLKFYNKIILSYDKLLEVVEQKLNNVSNWLCECKKTNCLN